MQLTTAVRPQCIYEDDLSPAFAHVRPVSNHVHVGVREEQSSICPSQKIDVVHDISTGHSRCCGCTKGDQEVCICVVPGGRASETRGQPATSRLGRSYNSAVVAQQTGHDSIRFSSLNQKENR